MRVLVIKFRNIGDVLLVGPLISSLKLGGATQVDALVKPGTEAMLIGHPHVDEVLVYPPRRPGESRGAYAKRELTWLKALRARRYDLVINTTEGDRGTILAFLSGAPRRVGVESLKGGKRWRRSLLTESRPALPAPAHTVVRNLDLLSLPGAQPYPRVHLSFTESDLATARAKLRAQGWDPQRPLIQIHPTSRWFFKCWNDADMGRTIDHLLSSEALQVVLTSGPGERERGKLDAILAHTRRRPIDLGGQLSLKETAALSSLCALYFGVDTAPMHMAAALDVPVVALFGPSGSFDWGPWPNGWWEGSTPYPARNGVQRQGRHLVIQKDWACAPCGRDGCQGSKRSACLEQLGAGQVIPLLDAAIARHVLESAPA